MAPLEARLGLTVDLHPAHRPRRLRAILAESDVAILRPGFDNSPMTIFEALSSGVPVITSDWVGTASSIEPENGLLALPIDDAVCSAPGRRPRWPTLSRWPAATGPPRRSVSASPPAGHGASAGTATAASWRSAASRAGAAAEEIEATSHEDRGDTAAGWRRPSRNRHPPHRGSAHPGRCWRSPTKSWPTRTSRRVVRCVRRLRRYHAGDLRAD